MADEEYSEDEVKDLFAKKRPREIEDVELPMDPQTKLAIAFARYYDENPVVAPMPEAEIDKDEEYLDPEYIDTDDDKVPADDELRIQRLENSVKALLRKSSQRASLRMINSDRYETGPEIKRKTPVRKAMSFSKEELAFLIALTNAVGIGENLQDVGDEAMEIASRLYNEMLALRSNWENEAYNNGEFF